MDYNNNYRKSLVVQQEIALGVGDKVSEWVDSSEYWNVGGKNEMMHALYNE